jgi:ubiquilin
MDTFGADGGMGAPPNPDQILRMLEDPNFASQMNEAMNNPAVLDMMRNNPMIRNNPIARQAIENPEFRRVMMSPDVIRMQMQMQRAMGGAGGGEGAFPMPGATDTTPSSNPESNAAGGDTAAANPANTAGTGNAAANPFAALFGGGMGNTAAQPNQQQGQNANPFGGLFGGAQEGGNQNNPLAQMTQQLMQNPQLMQNMMQMMQGANQPPGAEGESNTGSNPNQYPFGNFNPLTFGDFGNTAQQPQAPPDPRLPEERYENELRQLNDMGFYEFERNVQALRRSGGSVQGAVEYLLNN